MSEETNVENAEVEVEATEDEDLEAFVAACEAQRPVARQFFATEPVECADLDITLVSALIDEKFPVVGPLVVLSQEDFTMLLTGGIQIGYTLARRVDAGTLVEAEGETDEGGNEAGGE